MEQQASRNNVDRRSVYRSVDLPLLGGHMRASVLALLVMVATSAGWSPSLQAQSLRGQVVDSTTGTPVGAGFVVLLDAGGREIARTLSGRDGRFMLRVPRASRGRLRIRSERIGYQVGVTDWFEASGEDLSDLTIRVSALRTPLSAIEVRESTECKVRPREDEQTAVVWEEARKALAAASWTASRQVYHVVSNLYERDMDGRRRRVRQEQHRPSIGLSSKPFVSRAPAELLRYGYVSDEDGFMVYYAPDAEVLQDGGFLDTHCFRLRRLDDEGADLIGLAFEPVPSRNLPDVEGILWLDRQSSELRSLEFRYANLPRHLRFDDPSGGTVEFMPLPSGAWIVHRWLIEIPTAFRMGRVDPFDRQPRRLVDAYRATGGEVLTITDRAGTLVYEAELAELVGVVLDSMDGQPNTLAGAVAQIPGTWFADTTDQSGRFLLRVPLDGEYPVSFRHPRTDSLGFAPPAARVTLARGQTATTSLAMPPLGDILANLCPDRPPTAYSWVLVGAVQDSSTGGPAPGIPVVARWQHITPRLDVFNRQATAETDGAGSYALCGLEIGRPAIVYAVSSNGRSEVLRVSYEAGGVEVGGVAVDAKTEYHPTSRKIWRRDLTLRPTSGLNTLVAGTVTDAVSGNPIALAVVTAAGTGRRTQTDATGTFGLEGLPPGTHSLVLRQPGYVTRRGEVDVAADQPTIIGAEFLALTPVPQVAGTAMESETNTPVVDVWMTLISTEGDSVKMTRSDSLGAFVLTAPEPGLYYVRARRLGYAPGVQGPFQLDVGQAVKVEFSLRQLAFALDSLSVTAEAVDQYLTDVGFYARQKSNRGYFMDREQIEQRLANVADVQQLLSVLPGVKIGEGIPGSAGSVMNFQRGQATLGGKCSQPRVFVDGLPVGNEAIGGGLSQPQFVALSQVVQPEDVYAVEVYRTPSQIPPEFGGPETLCGVLLIWTIRGRN
jgi:hypothetical protein